MANENTPINPTQQILKSTTEDSVKSIDWNLVNKTISRLESLFAKAGKDAGESLGKNLSEYAEKAKSTLSDIFSGMQSPTGIIDDLKGATKAFESTFGKLMLEAGVSPDSLMAIKNDLMGAVDLGDAKNIVVGVTTQNVADGIKSSLGSIKKMEDDLLRTSRRGALALQGMMNPLSDNRGYKDLQSNLSAYRAEILKTMSTTKMSREEAIRGFAEMSNAGVDIDRIQKLRVEVEGGGEIDGLAASMLTAKAVGLSMSDVARQLNTQMRALGRSPKEAGEVFGIFNRVQADTTVNMSKVLRAVESGQDKMKMYGDATKSSATIFKAFLNSLGEGREELAQPLFDSVISGIQRLDREFGKSAFLGMGMDIGQGAGAIGAGLRVEESLASGEGIEGVLQSVQDRIEQFSGTGILTRKEAIDSGQEQQYEIQRKLLEQFLGVQGGQQQELVLQAFKDSDFSQIRDALTPPSEGALPLGMAQQTIELEQGRIGGLMNKLDAFAEASINDNTIKALTTSGDTLLRSGNIFRDSVDAFQRLVENPTRALASFNNAETETRAAADLKKGEFKAPSAESLSGFAAQSDKAGAALAGEMSSLSKLNDAAGLVSAEDLSSLSAQANVLKSNAFPEMRPQEDAPEFLQLFNKITQAPPLNLSELQNPANKPMGFDDLFANQAKASAATEEQFSREEGRPREQQVDLKVNVIAEVDERGIINIQPVIERISQESTRRMVEEKTSAPRE